MSSADTSSTELHDFNHHKEDAASVEFSLPPADRGKDAYLFLAGAFMLELLSYYSTHPQFSGKPGIAVIGTTASGVMYLIAPFVFKFLTQYPKHRRKCMYVGLGLCTSGLFAASFANTVGQLVATQGVMYALGGSLLYSPAIIWLDEWFIQRKGLAFGVMWAGTGVSGLVLPVVINAGLERYNFRIVRRAPTVAFFVLSAPFLHHVKTHIPLSPTSTSRTISLKFLLTPTFWALQTSNIFEGLGFFLPPLYLPTYAMTTLSLPPQTSSLLLSILNASSVPGQIFIGALSDRVHISTVLLVSAVGTTLSVFLSWGLAAQFPLLVVFAITYGFFAGGFSSTYTGICREVVKENPDAELGMVIFGVLHVGRDVGNVISGPLSEILLTQWSGSGIGAYGTKFGGLVVVTGVTAALSGLGWIARFV
ncbi:MFS general substrate transporter [Wilcoxina mikolae CBS 423.85]|nr:MFS general substrate transporter [Wilcoxina mikolae CBS 423.85]